VKSKAKSGGQSFAIGGMFMVEFTKPLSTKMMNPRERQIQKLKLRSLTDMKMDMQV